MNEAETEEDLEAECADVLILLCSIAHLYEFDLLGAAKEKMKINKKRKWKAADENGIIEHVKE